MRILKLSTENLRCYQEIDDLGNAYHVIYELCNANNQKPILIYINNKDLRVSEDLPANVQEYKYYNEACKLIRDLMEMGL